MPCLRSESLAVHSCNNANASERPKPIKLSSCHTTLPGPLQVTTLVPFRVFPAFY
jgi:hypothetical protein